MSHWGNFQLGLEGWVRVFQGSVERGRRGHCNQSKRYMQKFRGLEHCGIFRGLNSMGYKRQGRRICRRAAWAEAGNFVGTPLQWELQAAPPGDSGSCVHYSMEVRIKLNGVLRLTKNAVFLSLTIKEGSSLSLDEIWKTRHSLPNILSPKLTQDWKCHRLSAIPLDQKGVLVFNVPE